MITFEAFIEKCVAFVSKRDNHFVQRAEAIQATEASLRESAEADIAKLDADSALAKVKATAAALGESTTLQELFADVQVALAADGTYVLELTEAIDAASKAINEQAEADVATFDAQTALNDLKQDMAEFTL